MVEVAVFSCFIMKFWITYEVITILVDLNIEMQILIESQSFHAGAILIG